MSSYKETCISLSYATLIQQSSTYGLKTVIKNQYVHGTPIYKTFKNLYNNNDPLRFYRGVIPTITKAIIGRNSDILFHKFYSEKFNFNKEQNALISGLTSSIVKVSFIPLDTISNLYQVQGKKAKDIIKKQYKNENYFFYRGTMAYMILSGVGSSAWLYTYSYLNNIELHKNKNINNALIGVSASIMSDIVVNPIRILKTYKQSSSDYISYKEIIKKITLSDKNFIKSYFRGYGLRMGLNAFNSGMFMVLWKQFE
tara:strand:+ start:5622 stop:6386 length:765 start_codon:yes stop_codon:yes gene_type:complete